MDLRHLKYFVALTEEMNFTRAAARLHIAQPSLSMRIRKLEAEVGAELLSREGRSVKLTGAGRVFLEQARKILFHANTGVTLARRATTGEIGQLSIGHNHVAELRVLWKVVPAFRRQWPDVHLNFFHNLKISQQLEALRRDELDLAFTWLPAPTEGFDVQELAKEPLVVLLPADHRLASASTVSIKDLSREPMVMFPRAEYPDVFHQVEQLFVRAGAAMNVVYELQSPMSVMSFVAMGIGSSLLPDYFRRIRCEGVVYKPLRAPNVVRTLAIIKKKGRGGLAELFYRFTVDNLTEYASEKISRRKA
jgi:DNA-binding transcriptional LysR family regulator